MPESRNYGTGIRAALIHLSGGTCYWPGCPELVIRIINGKHKFALQIAHICALSQGGPRYDSSMTIPERNAFQNLILLCYFHHSTIDEDGQEYSTELLRQWKSARETQREEALQGLTWLTQDKLQELFDDAFTDRDREIKETLSRLEISDRQAAEMLRTLVDEITELRMRGSLVDADVVGVLDSAADRLGHLQDTAVWLVDSAQRLGHLQDTATWLSDAAQKLGNLQDTAGTLDDAARNLGTSLDAKIYQLEALIAELRDVRGGY